MLFLDGPDAFFDMKVAGSVLAAAVQLFTELFLGPTTLQYCDILCRAGANRSYREHNSDGIHNLHPIRQFRLELVASPDPPKPLSHFPFSERPERPGALQTGP
jgi:hypothetical protein